jgi:hypothetical protein
MKQMMRLVRTGLIVALGWSIFACQAGAQSTCVYDAAGRCIAGSVVAGQVVSQPPIAGTIVGQPAGSGVVSGGPVTYVGTSSALPAQGQVLPYSYWVSSPARIYVEYGRADQFPFLGRPYGSPNDRWSWYTMGGGAGRYLARYYYPILR